MEEKYRNYQIKYNEHEEFFVAKDEQGNAIFKDRSLATLKKKLDYHDKQKFERTPVIVRYWNEIEPAILTSETQDRFSHYAWVTIGKNKRKKIEITQAYKDNAANRHRLEKIKTLGICIKKLESKISKIKNSFEPYEPQLKIEK